jgi:hypothetical protein
VMVKRDHNGLPTLYQVACVHVSFQENDVVTKI